MAMSVSSLKAQSFESATDAVANMGAGWNLGNTLDANNGGRMTDVVKSETTWGQPVTKPELMAMMKNAGFGMIRVPVTWFPHMDENGNVDEAWMKRVHEVVDYVIDQGMYCLLNVHHDTGADSGNYTSWLKADETTYQNVRERYEHLWKQIATEFKDYDEHLLFESYNEMLDSYNSWCFASFSTPNHYDAAVSTAAYNAINSYAQSFVNVVRGTGGNNVQRNLVVNTYGACSGAGTWNSHLQDPLKSMKLPNDPAGKGHIIFQIHSYPNIDNISSARKEVDSMMAALKTHLLSKGAPAIIGEWGTSDSNGDYMNRRSDFLGFVDYFTQAAIKNGVGTIYWMGISNGSFRSLPAFSMPDLAERIVKNYRGEDFVGTYPTKDDFDITYEVTYTGDWQEMNLMDATISLSDYKGIRVELTEKAKAGALQVKCYGETSSKNQYADLSTSSAKTTISFSTASLGNSISRITLQTMKGAQKVEVKTAYLIKKDNTEEELSAFSPFWGCNVEMKSTPVGISLPAAAQGEDNRIYTLQGQLVERITRPGIYIRGGKKIKR